MAFFSDFVTEYKKAPPVGKIAIVGIGIAVAGIGFYEYRKSKTSSSGLSTTAGTASPSTDLSGTNNSQGAVTSLPNSNGGQTPIVSGLSPLFDALGNLIGWTGTPPATTGGNTPPPNNPPPSGTENTPYSNPGGSNPGGNAWNPFAALFGKAPAGFQDTLGNHATINNQVWTIVPGSSGRIWGVPGSVSAQTAANTPIAQGQKQLLYQGGGQLHKQNYGGQNQGGGDEEIADMPRSHKKVVQKYVVSTHGHMHAVSYEVA